MTKPTRKELCAKVRADVRYGYDGNIAELDEWQQRAHPYTVVLKYKRRKMTLPFFMGPALTHEPTALDVLDCLISDAATYVCCRSFEEWASDLGVDSDSRKAEAQYRAVGAQTEKLKKLLGDDFETFLYSEGE